MKIKRSSTMFEGSRRRRRLPLIPIILAIVVIGLLVLAWQRGGEQPQAPVEKAIPADRLGQ